MPGIGLLLEAAVHLFGRGREHFDHEVGNTADDVSQDARVLGEDDDEVRLEGRGPGEDDVRRRNETSAPSGRPAWMAIASFKTIL